MKFLYKCPKCSREHGGQTPAIKETTDKLCDMCNPYFRGYYDRDRAHNARLNYAILVSGAPIYDTERGEYI